ncbi:hypothetical protein C0J45_11997 [Silurus meridionalis]|nr:hypothetical protein C0J45_11997 [Silurus meridionalis]
MDRLLNPASNFPRKLHATPRGSDSPKLDHAPRPPPDSMRGFPARFSGERIELGGFLRSICEYVEVNLSQFSSERAKIGICISLLSGDALSKASTLWSAKGGDFGSYTSFIWLLLGMFEMDLADLHESPFEYESAPSQSFHEHAALPQGSSDRLLNPASNFPRKLHATPRGSDSPKLDHAPRPPPDSTRGFPACFSGERIELGGFLRSICEYVEVNFSQFSSERAKIGICISLLSGDALSKASMLWSAKGGDFGSYTSFIWLLLGMFEMDLADLHESPFEYESAPSQSFHEHAALPQGSSEGTAQFQGTSVHASPFQTFDKCVSPFQSFDERAALFWGSRGHGAPSQSIYERATPSPSSRGHSAPLQSFHERFAPLQSFVWPPISAKDIPQPPVFVMDVGQFQFPTVGVARPLNSAEDDAPPLISARDSAQPPVFSKGVAPFQISVNGVIPFRTSTEDAASPWAPPGFPCPILMLTRPPLTLGVWRGLPQSALAHLP